jgi:hypothetical protein
MAMSCSELLSTRLFPKQQGANAVVLTGVAARCDWVITSDTRPPLVELRRLRGEACPGTIFLSLRNPFVALAFFAEEVLPQLREPFVLISGSEDITLPLQCDQRWRPFSRAEDAQLEQIASHPLLRRWYAENLDWRFATKLNPLPLGVLPPTAADGSEPLLEVGTPPPVMERELLVLCAHRLRPGPQWQGRARLSQRLRSLDYPWLLQPEQELAPLAYRELLRRCSFVVCASGGGWDPNPKLWHALLQGAIPIVRSSPLDVVLAELPVWIVDRWEAVDWRLPALEKQRQALKTKQNDKALLLRELSLDQWMLKISQQKDYSA